MGAPETGSLKKSGRAAGTPPPVVKANPALDAEIAAIEVELDGFFAPDGGKKSAAPAAKRPAPAPALDAEIAAIKSEMEGLFAPGPDLATEQPAAARKGRGWLAGALLLVVAGAIAYYVWGGRITPPEAPRAVKAPEVTGGRITEPVASEPPVATVEAPPVAPAATPAAPPSRPQPAVQRPIARAVVPTVSPAMPERQSTPAVLATPVAPQPVPAAPAQPARAAVTHTKAAATTAAEPVAAKPAPATVSTIPAPVKGTACTPERLALGFCIENRTGEAK